MKLYINYLKFYKYSKDKLKEILGVETIDVNILNTYIKVLLTKLYKKKLLLYKIIF